MGLTDLQQDRKLTRFFIQPDQVVGELVNFDGDDAHHMFVVLKMRAGQTCIALDNTGRLMHVQLDELSRSEAKGHIVHVAYPSTEAQVHITIAQALPKTLDKLEWVLQHGTEVGVHEFVVFSSERARDNVDRFQRKLPRWAQIVKTAAEQSERTLLPKVTGIPTFSDLLAGASSHEVALMAYEREQSIHLRNALPMSARDILIIVGPEGGFTDDEVDEARAMGVATVSLGPRILRTETAALVMASQTLFALEPDLRDLNITVQAQTSRSGATATSW